MMSSILFFLVLTSGIAPEQMREIVAERLGRLDKLVVEMTTQVYTCPVEASPFDRSQWRPYGGVEFPHRITIVRPNMLDEELTDLPETGYVPVDSSVFDGGFVRRHVRPDRFGRTHYSVAQGAVQLGRFKPIPLLQVLDIHIQDSDIPQLNLLRLFDEHEVTLVEGVGDVSKYRATVPGVGCVFQYEFDLNGVGTPLRFKTVTEFEREGLLPAAWEMFILDTMDVNGAEFPKETVVTIHNPNVGDSYYGLHHFEVASVLVDESLTAQDVRIEPDLCNAVVRTIAADGIDVRRIYDTNGEVLDTQELLAMQSLVDGRYVSRQSLRWRRLVPAGAGTLGLLAIFALRLVSRQRRA